MRPLQPVVCGSALIAHDLRVSGLLGWGTPSTQPCGSHYHAGYRPSSVTALRSPVLLPVTPSPIAL